MRGWNYKETTGKNWKHSLRTWAKKMDNRSGARIFSSMLYLGLLFAGAGWVYYRIQHFEGIVVIGEGKAEHLAVQPAGSGGTFSANYRKMPIDVLPLADSGSLRKVLDPVANYDATELPFALGLTKIEVKDSGAAEEFIELQSDGETKRFPIKEVGDLALASISGSFQNIQPWVGLIAHPHGTPSALIRLNDPESEGGWSQKLFLEPQHWFFYKNNAVYFAWFPDEKQARDALPSVRPGIESARWGVEDGKRINWLNAFTKGTGMQLDNGNDITLLGAKLEEAVPVILVQIKRPDSTASRIRILAGEMRGGIHFEYPAVKENIIYLHAWQDNSSVMQVLSKSTNDANVPALAPLDTAENSNLKTVKIEQILAHAVPVDNSGDAIFAANVTLNGKPYELREGLRTTLDDGLSSAQYLRLPPPSTVRYHFNASSAKSAKQEAFTLADAETFNSEAWRFRLHPEIKPAPKTVVLLAERTFGGPAKYLGLAMFMFGAFGWVFIRFLKPGGGSRSNANVEDKLEDMLEEAERKTEE